MATARAGLTVGLVPQGGPQWIAGVIYLENIVRAVRAMDGNRPSLCYIAGPTDRRFDRNNHLTIEVPTYHYTHRSNDRRLRIVWNSVKSRRLPRSLETVARRIGLSALFPIQSPPGQPFPVPWVAWIPDFQHKRRPEFFSAELRAERDRRFQRIVDQAPHVVVSSQDARADLMRWFPAGEGRVSVLSFRTVLDPRWFDVDPRTVAAGLNLPTKYLIYPSQLWVHKNHRVVFAALRLLRARGRTDVVVVCTGQQFDHRHPDYADTLKEEIARLGLESQVRLLGLLDRPTQIQIMRASAAVLQASFFEGWSALVEDARALGKRLFVSDIPVHREQEPADAEFFNPECAEELADLVERAWPDLEPGPDPVRELRARQAQATLTGDFAHRFVDIVTLAGRTA
jgi:glycosyltransferase involved in cell wall biosynthesis